LSIVKAAKLYFSYNIRHVGIDLRVWQPRPDLYQARHTDFEPHDGPLQEVVDRLAQIPFEFQPGQRWNCGVSLDVPGRVVEVASGKPLDVFLMSTSSSPSA